MRRRNGFTLIELLIVLAMMAALLTSVIPVAVNAVRKGHASQIAQNLRAIKRAVEEYTLINNPMTELTQLSELRASLIGELDEEAYGLRLVTEDGSFAYFIYYAGQDLSLKEVVEHFIEVETGPVGTFGVYATISVMW